MRIIREKNLYQLTFMPTLFPVNCYFVEENDGLTLIDAALPYSADGILKAAKQIGKPITKIILTHAHNDHIGALDRLKETLVHVPVYISKRDARLLEGDTSLEEGEPQGRIKGGVPKNLKTRADVLLEDGDRVGSLAAISTPGHTPGSMTFIDTRNNMVIAGDAFQTRGGLAVAGDIQILFPFPAFATWNKELALSSAKNIIQLNPSLLAVGHGRMIKQPKDAMILAVQKAEQENQK